MMHHGRIYKKAVMVCFMVILIVLFVALPLLASRPYQPKIADPILEPWRWRSYPELDGLGVQRLTETADGSIWFGLLKGAMHYDGLHWTLYDDQNSLLGSTVNIVTQVNDGSIYFGTGASGLVRFSDGEWESVQTPHLDSLNQGVNCVIQTSDQR
ncbi:hypothetical protein MUP95_06575, partial [bacterium]|nr:hypothetical protein [bacterium]